MIVIKHSEKIHRIVFPTYNLDTGLQPNNICIKKMVDVSYLQEYLHNPNTYFLVDYFMVDDLGVQNSMMFTMYLDEEGNVIK